ncbi:MAG: hypothetical protein BWY17_04531 [Deltaproteobacteria bacterium ADurb.Bin207]|jgi:hypothetical protein|nr:MAG: hypothetical protein BWY17_04531 [Deltaproteobacteria bacterium ADurb.Bin207]
MTFCFDRGGGSERHDRSVIVVAARGPHTASEKHGSRGAPAHEQHDKADGKKENCSSTAAFSSWRRVRCVANGSGLYG